MKLSEFIAKLIDIQNSNKDLDVAMQYTDYGYFKPCDVKVEKGMLIEDDYRGKKEKLLVSII